MQKILSAQAGSQKADRNPNTSLSIFSIHTSFMAIPSHSLAMTSLLLQVCGESCGHSQNTHFLPLLRHPGMPCHMTSDCSVILA